MKKQSVILWVAISLFINSAFYLVYTTFFLNMELSLREIAKGYLFLPPDKSDLLLWLIPSVWVGITVLVFNWIEKKSESTKAAIYLIWISIAWFIHDLMLVKSVVLAGPFILINFIWLVYALKKKTIQMWQYITGILVIAFWIFEVGSPYIYLIVFIVISILAVIIVSAYNPTEKTTEQKPPLT